MTPTKKQLEQLIEVLDADYETVDEAAKAVMAKAWDLYSARAKYVVAGQVHYTPEGGWLDHDDAAASKVVLGPYDTLGKANAAQDSLTIGRPTGEVFRTWVIERWSDTPAKWFAKRKADMEKARKREDPGSPMEQARLERIDKVARLQEELGVDEYGRRYRAGELTSEEM